MSAGAALVIPWFGRELTGGAERVAWNVAVRLAARGHPVEVLTTRCAAFDRDWGTNHRSAREERVEGVRVRCFRVARRRAALFDAANARLLDVPRPRLRPGRAPVEPSVAEAFVRESIHAPGLLRCLSREASRFRAVVFLPYLYGPTLLGVERAGARAWLHPCLHDEVYAYLPQVARVFAAARGLLLNSEGEAELAARLYGPAAAAKGVVVGSGVEDPAPPAGVEPPPAGGDALPGRIAPRFALYLGRRDPTKGTDLLLRAHAKLRGRHPDADLELVLAGPGPRAPTQEGVVDLGLVDDAVKAQLLARATALVQPSRNESYSRAMMEAWRAGRPVVVHAGCAATAGSVRASGGGFIAGREDEWVEALARLADPEQDAALDAMGRAGRAHADDLADWDRVIDRYERALGLRQAPRPARIAIAARGVRGIHQILPTLAYGDAIGTCAVRMSRWLRDLGFESQVLARYLDPRMEGLARPISEARLGRADALIYHHSIRSEVTRRAAGHPGPKLLIYHNVTPSWFVAPYRPGFAELLERGREELPGLARHFPHSVGDSRWNADELEKAGFREPGVLPLAVDPLDWDQPPDPAWMERLGDGRPNLLFVGRIAPNKRQEHLIALLAHVLEREPGARLVLAGPEAPDDPYPSCLRLLAAELGVASRVVFTGGLSQSALHACYRSADVFVSASEHEGFGVPLIEAMWFEVPVLAYRCSAVPETLGEGGLLYTKKRWPELAALVVRLLRDPDLRGRVLRGQRRRREALRPEVLEPCYAAAINRLLADARPSAA